MLWRRCTSPDEGSIDNAAEDKASCERRISRLDLDFFPF